MSKDRRLGRGLAALLGTPSDQPAVTQEVGLSRQVSSEALDAAFAARALESPTDSPATPAALIGGPGDHELRLNVYEIDDNPFQPRRDFSEPEIASLAESLKEHDMLQPILVRRLGERYQLISGERRLRAAIQAGWESVPVRLREADDRLVAELAIVENLQRQDLNPIEKALSFKRYLDQHRCPQEDLARRLKIDRSTIANLMRLLELPDAVQLALREGTISAGHARALLPLGDETSQLALCHEIQQTGMSVRETERTVSDRIRAEDPDEIASNPNSARRVRTRNDQIASLEQELKAALGTKIEIRQTSRGRGRIVIHFPSHEEFERLHSILTDNGKPQLRLHAG